MVKKIKTVKLDEKKINEGYRMEKQKALFNQNSQNQIGVNKQQSHSIKVIKIQSQLFDFTLFGLKYILKEATNNYFKQTCQQYSFASNKPTFQVLTLLQCLPQNHNLFALLIFILLKQILAIILFEILQFLINHLKVIETQV
ncbi:unnamed protein product [Paramecium primaurelia]|uniref:Transmembrane protein n=1 Tax=Paramecium primaurelia TaxID=5886 RepID=A0A8S1QML6_PARPR|nr:unnamed protein product [Paramecium primaurelia]